MVSIILFIQRINPCVPQNNKNALSTFLSIWYNGQAVKRAWLKAVSPAVFVVRYWWTKLVCKIFSFSLTDGRNKTFWRVMFVAETSFSSRELFTSE